MIVRDLNPKYAIVSKKKNPKYAINHKKKKKKIDKLHIWPLSFTPYFNLVSNISIVLIWSLTFQYHNNLVLTIFSLMKIVDVASS